MKICDHCLKHKDKLNELIIKNKTYEICNDCLDEIIDFIKPKKRKPTNFLESMEDNLRRLNG
jgi:superfamily II helicase